MDTSKFFRTGLRFSFTAGMLRGIPYNTTVEAIIRKGKVEKLKLTPPTRVKDVIVMDVYN